MPRAFDRGIPEVDKNPLISATAWGDPNTIIGEAAANAAGQIQGFFFSLFEDCVEFLEGLKLLGEDGTNPIAQLGLGLQALIDQIYQLLFCGADPGITPQGLIEALSGIISGLADNVFIQGLVAFAEFIGTAVGNFAQDAIQGATDLVSLLCGILTCNPTAGLQAIDVAAHVTGLTGTTPFTIISGILDVFGPILANPFIQGVIALADEFGVAVGNFFLDIFNGVLGIFEALCSLLMTGSLPETYGNWTQTPLAILQMVIGVIEQLQANPIIAGLVDLIEGSGEFIFDLIGGALEFITQLVGLLGQVMSGPQAILDFLAGIFGANGLDGWIESLPFLGPLVSKLTGFDSSGDIALDLATLGNWASGLLTNTGSIPAANLIGSIPSALLQAIPVSAINLLSQNLLSQGDFANANTVENAGGWSWDGTTTFTGSGGSVRATGTGSLQQLYSRQAIKVGDGDRIDISALVKTSGFTAAAGRSMELSIVKWKPVAGVMRDQGTEVIGTARTTSAATFTALPATATTWTSSGGITHIQVRLAVTANTGAQIWFDDISVRKSGGLQQVLVDSLVAAWNQLWRGLTNPLLGTISGKTWEDLFGAASGFRSAFNTEEDRGGTLRFNLFGNRDTVGTTIGQSKITGLPAALEARQLATETLQSTIAQGYQIDYPTNGSSWAKPTGLSELYVVCFGGGAKGGNGVGTSRGVGGFAGGYIAAQIDVDDVPSSVPITIGINSSLSPAATSFGSLLSSADSYRGYVATPVGLLPTAGQPGDGGYGGDNVTPLGVAGQSTSIGSLGGPAGAAGGKAGGNGGNGFNFGLSITGGAGGGGGSYGGAGNTGGNGGQGGFPGGGGGGGGGSTSTPGSGGNGGLGYMLVIYKVARTTA